jgi:5-deoxy-glucuronate isomerase
MNVRRPLERWSLAVSEPKILTAGWDAVTPAEAGWTYISFSVETVTAGESFTLPVDGQERALVPLSGTAEVTTTDDQSWKLGGRQTVFDGLGWCLYLPLDTAATVTAVTDLQIAVAAAPATTKHQPVLVTPDDTDTELRGGGNASRQVNSLMLPAFPADRLHVIEVWTPGGNWSSYPPHKHEHDHDGEAELEETYYYRLRDPENGWGVQRVYSPERDFDLVQTVRDGDLLLIPWGYHTTAAAHGHDLYYLNVLAGPAPKRTLQAFQDPCLKPTQDAWPEVGLDARLPFIPRYPN